MFVLHQPAGNSSQAVKPASANAAATADKSRVRRSTRGWFAAPLVAVLLSGGLVACGSDSSESDNAGVPPLNPVSPLFLLPLPKLQISLLNLTPRRARPPPMHRTRDLPLPPPPTMAVWKKLRTFRLVAAAPTRTKTSSRNSTAKALISKAGDKNASANLQDQVIAAAKASCEESGDNRIRNYLPMAAGQLQAMGVVDKPEDAAKAIQDAAKKVYCK